MSKFQEAVDATIAENKALKAENEALKSLIERVSAHAREIDCDECKDCMSRDMNDDHESSAVNALQNELNVTCNSSMKISYI